MVPQGGIIGVLVDCMLAGKRKDQEITLRVRRAHEAGNGRFCAMGSHSSVCRGKCYSGRKEADIPPCVEANVTVAARRLTFLRVSGQMLQWP